jgi:hypothetical protein
MAKPIIMDELCMRDWLVGWSVSRLNNGWICVHCLLIQNDHILSLRNEERALFAIDILIVNSLHEIYRKMHNMI